jgi:hypothetical protein
VIVRLLFDTALCLHASDHVLSAAKRHLLYTHASNFCYSKGRSYARLKRDSRWQCALEVWPQSHKCQEPPVLIRHSSVANVLA